MRRQCRVYSGFKLTNLTWNKIEHEKIHLKGGDRRVRIFPAHNNWWATPEVSLPLPYQRSDKIFLNFFCDKE